MSAGAKLSVWVVTTVVAGAITPGALRSQTTPGAEQIVAEARAIGHVSLTEAIRIGSSGPGANPLGRVVVAADTSMVAVIDVINTAEINVYSRSGQHLRTIGRSGSGPGEFRNIVTLASYADSLYAYDNVLLRETVFDFHGRRHRERRLLPRTTRALPLHTGVLVANATDPTSGRIGAPLHVLDGDGVVLRSFPGAGGGADEAPLMRRSLARSSTSNTFWAGRPTDYRLELWNDDGDLMKVIARKAQWFPSHRQMSAYRQDVAPLARLWDVHEDVHGLIWVLIHVADARWATAFKPAPAADMAFNGDHDSYWDTIIEVIDPRRALVIATTRFDTFYSGFTNTGHVFSYHELGNEPAVYVWNVAIRP